MTIKEIRIKLCMTQQVLAALFGASRSLINHEENHTRRLKGYPLSVFNAVRNFITTYDTSVHDAFPEVSSSQHAKDDAIKKLTRSLILLKRKLAVMNQEFELMRKEYQAIKGSEVYLTALKASSIPDDINAGQHDKNLFMTGLDWQHTNNQIRLFKVDPVAQGFLSRDIEVLKLKIALEEQALAELQ